MEPSSSSSNAIVLRIRIPKKNQQQQQQQKVQDTNLGKTTYSATQQSLMHDCNTRIEPKQYQYHQGQLPQRNDSNPVSPTHASTQFLSIPTPKRQQNPNTWSYPDSLRNKGTPSPTSDSCFMVNEKMLFTGVNSTTPSVPLSRVTSQLDIKIPGPDHLDENGSSGGSQSQSQYKQSAHAWHIVNVLGNDLNEDLENGGRYKMEIVSEEVNVEENGQVRVGFSRQTKMSGLAETMLRNDSKMDVDEIWPTDLANCDTFEDVLMDADIERPNIMRSNSFDSTFSDNSPSPRFMVSHSIDNISRQDPDHEKYPNVSIKYLEFYFDRNSSLSRRFAKESDTDGAMSLDSQISVDKHLEQFLHSDSMPRRKRPLVSDII
ncbi:hypothetical protein BKA69DRAFT_623565 [Paraphysoderma sedebokerense]|nr:hypothetical protein BKA69DRAFT_623458 [Paraphysoderma sedebokerense]KAI9139576.1 hypothetical protein BKA69DRAFT_623565 [Paraphysoderma sedebokerense]